MTSVVGFHDKRRRPSLIGVVTVSTAELIEPLPEETGPISLEQLIALNDEIIALVRAGIPLDRGLGSLSRDLTGRLKSMTSRMASNLHDGQALTEVLDHEKGQVPALYRAIVEAGMKSGRLPSALEGLADFARGYVELRRAIGLALLYPLILLCIAYTFFVGFVHIVLPRVILAFDSLDVAVPSLVHWLSKVGDYALYWGPIGPVLLLCLIFWWLLTGRSSTIGPDASAYGLGWFPWMKGVMINARSAQFSELLALLIDHDVPMHQALTLAADATASPAIIHDAHKMSELLQRGAPLAECLQEAEHLPGMLRWMLAAGQTQGSISKPLRLAASTYRRRALQQAQFVRVFLPTILLITIGATATLIYTLTIFVPMADLLTGLSDPN